MNKIKSFLVLLTIPFLIFCTPQKTDNKQNKVISTASLIGKWKQVNKLKSSDVSDPIIEHFQLINDSIVNIQIIESNKRRTIAGKWRNGYSKKIDSSNFKINAGVMLSYNITDNHQYILALKLDEENGETIMLADKFRFEKEKQ